jgi:periplasmic protein TonB
MKSVAPLAGTLLLHLTLIAGLLSALPGSEKTIARQPLRVSVALLAPPPAPLKPALSAPAATSLPPPPAKTKMHSPRVRRPAAPSVKPAPPEPSAMPAISTETAAAPQTAQPTQAPPAPPLAPVLPPQSPPAPAARTDVSIPARYAASNQKPHYPQLSRAYDEEGTVVLQVLVQADGHAGAVQIKASSGYPRLDDAATAAVRAWRFSPATVDGKPIARWYQVPIPFKLQDN